MKILVVGSGGREHALAWKLKQSAAVDRLFCAPGNAGTEQVGENVAITANDLPGLVAFAKQNKIGLTVIGPDDSLAAGVADLFEAERLPVFGPTKSAARLESSKIFAKEMMRRCHIPTALAGSFERSSEALKFCERLQFPLVIKADGLALGKGVVIAQNCDEAIAAIQSMMEEGKFGEAGRRIVVEEFLRGVECSLHALVSGGTYRMLASARDHKRAGDGDTGPNTGGMGAVSPADNWSDETQREFNSTVMTPLLSGLDRANIVFRGLLFPGLMLTEDGARVLEFNCRFGDPETQAILPRLRSDLAELLFATVEGRLAGVPIEWDPRTAVTVVMASGGYPGNYDTGEIINGLDACSSLEGVQVFHAGTRRDNGNVVTAGGRVLAITALGDNTAQARERAYEAVSRVHFEGCHYRRDIALPLVAANVAFPVMLRLLLVCLCFSLAADLRAQSPARPAGSPTPAPAPSAAPPPPPGATPTVDSLINSMAPADLQQAVLLLKSNYINPEALNEAELNRAMLTGLLTRLSGGAALLPDRAPENSEATHPFHGELLDGHIGYLRLGALTNPNLQAMDARLQEFSSKKADAVALDLRASPATNDFEVAAEFAKRFCPKGKLLFSLRKTAGKQERTFGSDRDPAFQGLVIVLTDGDTAGPAEAIAGVLRLYNKALIIGQPTAGRAVEFSDLPLNGGRVLRVAVAEAVLPEDRPLFPGGLKPDVPVEMSPGEKRAVFQQSLQGGMGPFVFESERPHLNEAALLAGRNPELEALETAQRRARAAEKPQARDAVLQRALDVVTSLAIYQQR